MKKLIIISFLLIPNAVFATTTIPWIASSTPSSFIQPNLVNGVTQALKVTGTATSTINKLEVDQINVTTGATMPISLKLTGFTQGSVLFVGAGSILDQSNSAFFFDKANGRVGIGTTNPLDALNVNSAVTTVYRGNATLYDTTAFAAGVGGQLNFGGKYNIANLLTEWAGIQGAKTDSIDGHWGGYLQFRTRANGDNLTTKMVIDGSGNVGIGTTTPGGILSLAGGSPTIIMYDNNAPEPKNFFTIQNNANTLAVFSGRLNVSADERLLIGGNGNATLTSNSLKIQTTAGGIFTGTTLINLPTSGNSYFNNGGNVGIGTTSPQGKLDISASDTSTTLTTFSGARSLSLVNTNTTANNANGLVFRTMDTNGLITTGSKIMGVYTSHTANAVSGDMAFLTNNAGTVGEKMRIQANGNVGIGTTVPGAQLHLNTVAGTNAFKIGSTTTQFIVDSQGNVGIGTTTPGAKLHIVQSGTNYVLGVGVTNNATPFAGVIQNDTSLGATALGTQLAVANTKAPAIGNSTGISFLGTGRSTDLIEYWNIASVVTATDASVNSQSADLVFNTKAFGSYPNADTERVRIKNNGNVGIGTTSPTGLLELNNTSLASDLQVALTGSQVTLNTNITNRLSHFTLNSGGNITLNPFASNAYVLVPQGNVGIGTTSPSTLLSVQGGAYVSNTLFVGGAITGTSTLSLSGTGNSYILGNVGIGTTTPGAKLNIYSSVASSTPLLLEAVSGGGCALIKDVAGTGYTQIYTQAGVIYGMVHTGALTSCN